MQSAMKIYIWVFDGLGRFYVGQGLYALAQPWYQQSVSIVKSRLGENHPDTATSLNNLANLYLHQGKYEQAEPLYIQTLELRKQFLGENHPNYADKFEQFSSALPQSRKVRTSRTSLYPSFGIKKTTFRRKSSQQCRIV